MGLLLGVFTEVRNSGFPFFVSRFVSSGLVALRLESLSDSLVLFPFTFDVLFGLPESEFFAFCPFL